MLRMRLKISGIKVKWAFKRALLHCLIIALLLLISSCAAKRVEMPSYEGVEFEDALSGLRAIQTLEAVLSIDYEKNGNSMSGDALLEVSRDNLNLRLYYLGFLAGEVKERNGIVNSNPQLDRYKSALLVDGLKNSFLWWDIDHYALQENDEQYVLKNSYRKILINKKSLLPVQQIIEVYDGEELHIFYDVPVKAETEELSSNSDRFAMPVWYQSRLKIEFKKHVVNVKVKSYEFKR